MCKGHNIETIPCSYADYILLKRLIAYVQLHGY